MADYKTYRAYKSPDPPSYGEAVTRARRFLEGCIAGNGQGLLKNRSLAAPRDYQAMNSEVLGAAMLRTRPGELVAWASEGREGWEALSLAVAIALERGDEIPDVARQWLALVLRGDVEKPQGTAGAHTAEGLHLVIYLAVQMLVERGMRATRNDASAPESACDAVASAMTELGREPRTFHGVKKIWLAMRRQIKNGIAAT